MDNYDETLKQLELQIAQAKLSGDSDFQTTALYLMRSWIINQRDGVSSSKVLVNMPRQSGKSTGLKRLYDNLKTNTDTSVYLHSCLPGYNRTTKALRSRRCDFLLLDNYEHISADEESAAIAALKPHGVLLGVGTGVRETYSK